MLAERDTLSAQKNDFQNQLRPKRIARRVICMLLHIVLVYNFARMTGYSTQSTEDLLRACAEHGGPDVWEEFIRRVHPLIARVVLRSARRWGEASAALLDDLIQEVYLKICQDHCRMLREFEPRHPDAIFGYIKIVAANLVNDHFKAARSLKRNSPAVIQNDADDKAVADPQGFGSAKSAERQILLAEVDAALNRVATGPDARRGKTIFWLYYRQGLSARAIAEAHSTNLNIKGVESVILRLTRLVREDLIRPGKLLETNASSEGISTGESF